MGVWEGESTFEISSWTSYERSDNVSDGVDGIDDTRGRRAVVRVEAEVVPILGVAVDGTHQGSIVAVDAGVEHGYGDAAIQLSTHHIRRG